MLFSISFTSCVINLTRLDGRFPGKFFEIMLEYMKGGEFFRPQMTYVRSFAQQCRSSGEDIRLNCHCHGHGTIPLQAADLTPTFSAPQGHLCELSPGGE